MQRVFASSERLLNVKLRGWHRVFKGWYMFVLMSRPGKKKGTIEYMRGKKLYLYVFQTDPLSRVSTGVGVK